jgi:hypothetical protein
MVVEKRDSKKKFLNNGCTGAVPCSTDGLELKKRV